MSQRIFGFDPSPFNEDTVSEALLKALASKEAGPPHPGLTPQSSKL